MFVSIVFIDGVENADIFVVDLNGGAPVNVTNSPFDERLPVFSSVYGGPCFIATAAYGSFLHDDLRILRDFRDRHLLTNAAGRTFVDFYYATSPPIAAFIAKSEFLKLLTRAVLMPVIYFVKYPAGGFAVLVLLTLAGTRRYRRRRKLR